MPTTRSSSRLATKANIVEPLPQVPVHEPSPVTVATQRKRKNSTPTSKAPGPKKPKPQPAPSLASAGPIGAATSGPLAISSNADLADTPVPAILSFGFEEAMQHLVNVDSRFQDLFEKMPCRPFEHLEQVHPFRALAISILGQQISWRAAHSITHKFIRLYNPSIPEEATDESRAAAMEVFPSPEQVSQTEVALLRTAGLSGRKAQYVQDLARRFAGGSLSTKKLLNANDEELAEMLIEVKGIGRWTVDMFAIFSLRRPDILPTGDLGVQRGLVRWFLSLHSPAHPYTISPEKIGGATTPRAINKGNSTGNDQERDVLPTATSSDVAGAIEGAEVNMMISDAPLSLPPLFTPSIQKTLSKAPANAVQLPQGITTAVLKSRLDGKKNKGAFLTPQEMNDLTDCWKPFRSLGVYYMWSLADPSGK